MMKTKLFSLFLAVLFCVSMILYREGLNHG